MEIFHQLKLLFLVITLCGSICNDNFGRAQEKWVENYRFRRRKDDIPNSQLKRFCSQINAKWANANASVIDHFWVGTRKELRERFYVTIT